MKGWEALKALMEGKKVFHPCGGGTVLSFDGKRIIDQDGDTRSPACDMFLKSEWRLYEEPGHDWAWACDQLISNNKVRRRVWCPTYYWRLYGGLITEFNSYGRKELGFKMSDIYAEDWELYAENQ